MTQARARTIIIGAGPTGLAAGYQLQQAGDNDFIILESAREAGGLSGSVIDRRGFTWDHGGHVVFSHYGEFDRLLNELMGDEVEQHDRSSFVYRDAHTLVPYPYQDHPRYLAPDDQLAVILGLMRVHGGEPRRWANLDDLARNTFGTGIYEQFFRPYNEKVWSTSLTDMGTSWIEERVSIPDLERVVRNITHGEDSAWGPNATFTFPAVGGTGEIWRRLAARLSQHIIYGAVVDIVLPEERVLWASGRAYGYEHLISTMPLDLLVDRLHWGDDIASSLTGRALSRAAAMLQHNKVQIVGIGVEDDARPDWSWSYFPQPRDEVPFYRITNLAKYAASNAPTGCSSYMAEISYRADEPVEDAVQRTIDALLNLEVMRPAEIRSTYNRVLPYAYPVPTVDRDKALHGLLSVLDSFEILSRGRFGSWRYEIGNQDHSVKQGLEAASRVLSGDSSDEKLIWDGLI